MIDAAMLRRMLRAFDAAARCSRGGDLIDHRDMPLPSARVVALPRHCRVRGVAALFFGAFCAALRLCLCFAYAIAAYDAVYCHYFLMRY